MMGTKWKPHETVEFKHVVEFSERVGRMSDDSLLLGRVWNEMQSAKGKAKTIQARADNLANLLEVSRGTAEVAAENTELAQQLAAVQRDRAEKAESEAAELKTEAARLSAGWHEANGKVLEVGLERTRLKADAVEMAKSIAHETELPPGIVDRYLDQPAAPIPVGWAASSDVKTLFVEDDARPPDREMLPEAWRRLFGKDIGDETELDNCDHGDAFGALYSGGRIAWNTCEGGRIERLRSALCAADEQLWARVRFPCTDRPNPGAWDQDVVLDLLHETETMGIDLPSLILVYTATDPFAQDVHDEKRWLYALTPQALERAIADRADDV